MSLVSFIIPTYNEDEIEASLERLSQHLLGIESKRFEIILVDDSGDEAWQKLQGIVKRTIGQDPRVDVRLLQGPKLGKGAAVRAGARESQGDIVFTIDADLPVPLEYIDEFLTVFEQGDVDIAIGERPLTRNVKQPVRFVLSRFLFMFAYVGFFYATKVADSQCGFKAYRGPIVRALAARQIVDGGMFDIEYLYVAIVNGRKIVRVPVKPHVETRPSKIRVWRCMYKDPVDLLRVKARGIVGGYRNTI